MNTALAQAFFALAGKYTGNSLRTIEKLWTEIQTLHSQSHRYYHTLDHLEQILTALQPVWKELENADAVLFALFYHDSIYNPQSTQNEEDSADLAHRRMQEIGVPVETIQKCNDIILATKSHHNTGDRDTDLFTDADLSILGTLPEAYEKYARSSTFRIFYLRRCYLCCRQSKSADTFLSYGSHF